MNDIAIWIVAGVIILASVCLFAVVPFSIVPRRPMRPDESPESAVNAAQNEAELRY
ncbi:MAG: hypothetical protein M3439_09605 [Chloroflexota bacterium]|nr:hypothetical protein [Chloroflexota bacterium]